MLTLLKHNLIPITILSVLLPLSSLPPLFPPPSFLLPPPSPLPPLSSLLPPSSPPFPLLSLAQVGLLGTYTDGTYVDSMLGVSQVLSLQ